MPLLATPSNWLAQSLLRLAILLLPALTRNSAAAAGGLFGGRKLGLDEAGATMPRPFECYSCMSASYQPKWAFLKEMYFAPKAFTDACDESIHRRSPIPTVLCASFCVSMLEPSVEAGVFVGFKYIRGCGDRILRHGFNQTALQIHRFAQVDKCRQLPRAHLFNQPRQLETAITGNLQLCTCYGEHCNGSSSSAADKLAAANSALLLAFMAALISLALSRHIA